MSQLAKERVSPYRRALTQFLYPLTQFIYLLLEKGGILGYPLESTTISKLANSKDRLLVLIHIPG